MVMRSYSLIVVFRLQEGPRAVLAIRAMHPVHVCELKLDEWVD